MKNKFDNVNNKILSTLMGIEYECLKLGTRLKIVSSLLNKEETINNTKLPQRVIQKMSFYENQ